MKPSPFTVVEAEQNIFYKWGSYLALQYRKKSPFATHPITEVFIGKENSRTIAMRELAYNAAWVSYVIVDRKQNTPSCESDPGPEISYHSPLPVSTAKFNDLQVLSQFCGPLAKEFYKKIKMQPNIKDDNV